MYQGVFLIANKQMLRSVLIFPKITQSKTIQQIRNQYDPLASHIRPHISLVFPFDSNRSNQDILKAVEASAKTFFPFIATFNKLGHDDNGYVWLAASTGRQKLIEVHDALYEDNCFSSFLRQDIPYNPHITLGKVKKEDTQMVMEEIEKQNIFFSVLIETLSIENILPNGDSNEFAQIKS